MIKQVENRELSALVNVVRKAGASILEVQKSGFVIEEKVNADIVTRADVLANDILKAELIGRFPDYGWLSEESSDNSARLLRNKVWVVDPIDGTREFATGVPEFAISAALVDHGEPVAACVYNPATDELFHALKNGGAWLNGRRIHCMPPVSLREIVVLASRSEYRRGEWDRFLSCCHVRPVGSIAYKLALVAAGAAHATFSLGRKMSGILPRESCWYPKQAGLSRMRRGRACHLIESVCWWTALLHPKPV